MKARQRGDGTTPGCLGREMGDDQGTCLGCGATIGPLALLVVGTTLARSAPLMTGNTSEFLRI